MRPIAAIVLAAGYSTRMKDFKPLLPLCDDTVIGRLVSTFLSCGIDTLVVAGYRGNDLRAALKDKNVTVVDNPAYASGMFSSVQAGVRALKQDYSAFFVMPVDIPLVRPSTIRLLEKAAVSNPGKAIYPVFNGKRGHPPLVPIAVADKILKQNTGGNLKDILESGVILSCEVPVDDKYILMDLDTPEDYRKML
jgi:molybdenum cofactor cytidylyltransferase